MGWWWGVGVSVWLNASVGRGLGSRRDSVSVRGRTGWGEETDQLTARAPMGRRAGRTELACVFLFLCREEEVEGVPWTFPQLTRAREYFPSSISFHN